MASENLTREQWMIAVAFSGAVQALNAPFCSYDNEEEAVNAQPDYIPNVGKKIGELCGRMQIEDAISVLEEALKHTERSIPDKSSSLESLKQALHAANGCLIENGDGPTALTPAGIDALAEPLLDDLVEAGFVPPV